MDDTLLGVNPDVAAATEVHLSMMVADEVMTMRIQNSVLVTAQGNG